MRGNGFTLREGIYLYKIQDENFYDEGGETLELVAQDVVEVPCLETFKVMSNGSS